jgi:hypothetical protein
MIEALFLISWSVVFLILGYLSLTKIKRHFKVYLLIWLNCLYLCGIFSLFPYIRQWFDLP